MCLVIRKLDSRIKCPCFDPTTLSESRTEQRAILLELAYDAPVVCGSPDEHTE